MRKVWKRTSDLSKYVIGSSFDYREKDCRRSIFRIEEFGFNFDMFTMHPFGDANLTIRFLILKFWNKIKLRIIFLCSFVIGLWALVLLSFLKYKIFGGNFNLWFFSPRSILHFLFRSPISSLYFLLTVVGFYSGCYAFFLHLIHIDIKQFGLIQRVQLELHALLGSLLGWLF